MCLNTIKKHLTASVFRSKMPLVFGDHFDYTENTVRFSGNTSGVPETFSGFLAALPEHWKTSPVFWQDFQTCRTILNNIR